MPPDPSSQQEPAASIRPLSDADAQALDAIIEARAHGSDVGPMPPASRERADKLHELLSLLDRLPDAETRAQAEQGVQATLDAVRNARQRERFASQVQMLAGSSGSLGFSWREVAAAVAIFLVAATLLLPFLEKNQTEAARIACASNLRQAGQAFQHYANDHDGQLPRGEIRPGAVWWNVGQAGENGRYDSNTAHLFLLVRGDNPYLSAAQLACPLNPDAQTDGFGPGARDWAGPEAVSYSYQNQYTPEPIQIEANPALALLADKNPLFVVKGGRITFDPDASPTAASRLHGGRGQNVLTADGAVRWTIRPMVPRTLGDQDNIWMLEGRTRYTGTESPDGPDDSFLVP
ncbi:MAG: hypothetical protein ACLFV3_00830 [Phycisphaeraceae bacterium]